MKAVDVHGFAGGFSLGVRKAGFELVAKHEGPDGFGAPLMEGNRHLYGDFASQYIPADQWSPIGGSVDLVFGNPPCSGFSGRSTNSFRGVNSPINHCMADLMRLAAKYDPEIVIMESVQPAFKIGLPLMHDLHRYLEGTTGHDYDLFHCLHNAAAVGGNCNRRRYFFVASRIPFAPILPDPIPTPLTVKELIGDLPSTPGGWNSDPDGQVLATGNAEGRTMALLEVANHLWPQGGNEAAAAKAWIAEGGRLPDNWFKDGKVPANRLTEHSFTNKRMRADLPPYVLDGAALSGRIHPHSPRLITFREEARMMGFPDDLTLAPCAVKPSQSRSWMGKGVTVGAGRWIAESAAAALRGETVSTALTQMGPREFLFDNTRRWSKP